MTQTEPQLAETKRIRWGAWVGLWIALLVVQEILLANNAALDSLAWRTTRWVMGDQDAYQWEKHKAGHDGEVGAAFYDRVDPPLRGRLYKRTEGVWRLFRDLGEPYTTVLLVVLVWIYDRRGWKAAAMLLGATIGSGLVGELIRVVAGRHRPIETGGENIWALGRGFYEGHDLSWPSGHSTLAFATAAVLVYLSPRGRWLFIVLACGCAAARVVMQAHFWSDAVFGSVLGWTVGWVAAVLLDRLIPPAATRATATT